MKVLHVTGINGTGGGLGKYVFSLAKESKKNNFDSVIVCRGNCQFSSFMLSEGYKSVIIPEERITIFGKNIFFYRSIYGLIKLIKEEKIDLIHAHNPHSALLSCIAAKYCGIPSVFTVHGAGRTDKQKFNFGFKLIKVMIKEAVEKIIWFLIGILISKIIMVSAATKKIYEPLLFFKKKIVVIHNGVNLQIFNYSSNFNKDFLKNGLSINGHYVIGSVGNLDEDKGFSYLIEAIAKLKLHIDNIRLVLVGEGSERGKLESLANNLNVSQNIVFAGFRKDIPELLSVFDIFVLPSLCEGFGYAIVEALAMKKVVVATQIEGIVEIIENEKTGILVPPKSSEAIFSALLRITKDENLKTRLGEEGYSLVKKKFKVEMMWENIYNVYKELIPASRW